MLVQYIIIEIMDMMFLPQIHMNLKIIIIQKLIHIQEVEKVMEEKSFIQLIEVL